MNALPDSMIRERARTMALYLDGVFSVHTLSLIWGVSRCHIHMAIESARRARREGLAGR